MPIDRVRQKFHDALEVVDGQAAFLATAIKLRLRSAQIFSYENIGAVDRPIVDRFRASHVGSGDTAFQALYVSICFHFEEFVRDIHRTALDEINRRYASIDQIQKGLLDHHVVVTGTLMSRIFVDSRASRLDLAAYARNVAGCVTGATNYKLNSDAFTFFFRGATIGAVEKVFEQIGFKINWDVIGRSDKLKNHFKGGGAREIGKLTKKFVDDFVDERNRIVHRGGGYKPIAESTIKEAVDFFKIFSTEFSTILSRFCVDYLRAAS